MSASYPFIIDCIIRVYLQLNVKYYRKVLLQVYGDLLIVPYSGLIRKKPCRKGEYNHAKNSFSHGCDGEVRRTSCRHLKKDGFDVRVLTRDKEKASQIFDESYDIVEGDPLDTNALERVLSGCFGVHMSISPPGIEPLVAEHVATIASQKRLERITYVSGTNNSEENSWHYIPKVKLAAEKTIRESGIAWTVFCPTAAMENLPVYVQGNRAGIFGKQPHPLHWYAADDFGRMVATSYNNEAAVEKRLFIHGPEGILTHEALRRFCSVFHPEIKKISTMPFWLAKIISNISGNKGMKIAVLATYFYEKVGEGGDPTEANRILGAPTITFDEWLEKRKERLGATAT